MGVRVWWFFEVEKKRDFVILLTEFLKELFVKFFGLLEML
jgi:hypothetical protein